jgi:hypothetical protein
MQDLYLIAIQSVKPEEPSFTYESLRYFIAGFGFFLSIVMARWVLEQ